ncbi:hypothetical protein [Rubrobacter calidifluminis]|uniref:hypothetical protein n=1 Tax=Rubrobacter calidifluminis TaxID=1392640 RepID=UPI00236039E8|nr:hypothetical protein [Rubrobacter calidifluminis]
MAYPTAGDIRARLPDGAPGLSDSEIEGLISDWKARTLFAGDTTSPDSPLAEQAVTRGAAADALELLYVREGYSEVPVASSLRNQAKELLALYEEQRERSSGEEPQDSPLITFESGPW